MSELPVIGVMKAIVPITRFIKGGQNRIFDESESGGTKILMKNHRPACVRMSPGQKVVNNMIFTPPDKPHIVNF